MKKKSLIVVLFCLTFAFGFAQASDNGFNDYIAAKEYEKNDQLFSAYNLYLKAQKKGYPVKIKQIDNAFDKKVERILKSPEKSIILIKDYEKCFSEKLIWDLQFTFRENSSENKLYIDIELIDSSFTENLFDSIPDVFNDVPVLNFDWPKVSEADSTKNSNQLIEGIATVDYRGVKFNSAVNKLYDISFVVTDKTGKVIFSKDDVSVCKNKTLTIKNPSASLIKKNQNKELEVKVTKVEIKYGSVTGNFDGDFSKLTGLSKTSVDFDELKIKVRFYAENPLSKGEGKVLNIYVWNDEFEDPFYSYYASKLPADVKVNFVHTSNQYNAYQNKLDEALRDQDKAAADKKIDIFLVEADYALKYVDTPYTLDIKKDLGITDAQLSNQFDYTKDVVTDSKGNLKGVSWLACPGGFIYRRSYAKEVLGTDDPDEIQKMISDWNKFDQVAKKMKDYGYCMLSGYDDAFRAFSDNMTSPWVVDNKIVVAPQIHAWIKQTKEYTDKGYNNRASLWSAESTQGMMADGKVFGYFGPAWFIDFCMPHDEGSAFGDWAFCKGPQGFSWGGTWLCAAAGSDNLKLIKDIFLTLTCDADTMTTLAKEKGDFANNEKAMAAVAASDYCNDFLGGQNSIPFFIDSAKSIHKKNITIYDQALNEMLMDSMKDYFDGWIDLNTAWENFYSSVLNRYPNLHR